MVALTYGDTRVSGAEAKVATRNATKTNEAPRQTWFARFLAAMQEARMRQAEREIRLHAPMLRHTLDAQAQLPLESADSKTPRGGW